MQCQTTYANINANANAQELNSQDCNNNNNNSNNNTSNTNTNNNGSNNNNNNSTRRYRPQKYCGVCGDTAIACNFNAVTCESCKAFFRRNAYKESKLKCLFNSKCEIDKVTRRFCSKCRLLKCLSIGMKREWILTDEQKQNKRVKIMQNKQMKKAPDLHLTSTGVRASCASSPTTPPPPPSLQQPPPLHMPTPLTMQHQQLQQQAPTVVAQSSLHVHQIQQQQIPQVQHQTRNLQLGHSQMQPPIKRHMQFAGSLHGPPRQQPHQASPIDQLHQQTYFLSQPHSAPSGVQGGVAQQGVALAMRSLQSSPSMSQSQQLQQSLHLQMGQWPPPHPPPTLPQTASSSSSNSMQINNIQIVAPHQPPQLPPPQQQQQSLTNQSALSHPQALLTQQQMMHSTAASSQNELAIACKPIMLDAATSYELDDDDDTMLLANNVTSKQHLACSFSTSCQFCAQKLVEFKTTIKQEFYSKVSATFAQATQVFPSKLRSPDQNEESLVINFSTSASISNAAKQEVALDMKQTVVESSTPLPLLSVSRIESPMTDINVDSKIVVAESVDSVEDDNNNNNNNGVQIHVDDDDDDDEDDAKILPECEKLFDSKPTTIEKTITNREQMEIDESLTATDLVSYKNNREAIATSLVKDSSSSSSQIIIKNDRKLIATRHIQDNTTSAYKNAAMIKRPTSNDPAMSTSSASSSSTSYSPDGNEALSPIEPSVVVEPIEWKGKVYNKPAVTEAEVLDRLAKMKLYENERELIIELLDATRSMFEATLEKNQQVLAKQKTRGGDPLGTVVQIADSNLRRLIKTVKRIKAFRILSMDDQIVLLKTACFKILLLRSTYNYRDDLSAWYDTRTGKLMKLDVLKLAKKSSVYQKQVKLFESFPGPLRRDRLVLSFMSVAILFDRNVPLKHCGSVELDNLNYLSLLRKYLINTQPDPLEKYQSLMTTMAVLEETNDEYNVFFSKDFQPEQITPLLLEIFDISN